ncbi:MAG: hypothetical protein AB1668_04385 [Nanoarchaeota archaeon]
MNIRRVKFKDIEQIPKLQINNNFKQDFFGTAPAPFIGRFGYPNVNIGVLSPQFIGDIAEYDSPRLWSSSRFAIGKIAGLRYSLVNSRKQWNIKDVHKNSFKEGKFLDIVRETGMAKEGTELEISLKKAPKLPLGEEKEIIPFGPASEILKARITANAKVDSKVEKAVANTDLKAAPAVIGLYNKGFEENVLSKLISAGNLGLERKRKLVPTRWSITAVDDTLGKQLIAEIKEFNPGEFQAYFGGEWGNYYLLLFFPEVWSFELFETYLGHKVNPCSKEGNFYSADYESYEGRKSYAQECAGGYYACRLSILEKMKELKRQGSCLALRFISSEYNVPLGVWVCREAARKSLQDRVVTFSDEALMLAYAKDLIRNKFGFDLELLLKESKLLKNKKEQKKLNEF